MNCNHWKVSVAKWPYLSYFEVSELLYSENFVGYRDIRN
jgi:hypothetical protein